MGRKCADSSCLAAMAAGICAMLLIGIQVSRVDEPADGPSPALSLVKANTSAVVAFPAISPSLPPASPDAGPPAKKKSFLILVAHTKEDMSWLRRVKFPFRLLDTSTPRRGVVHSREGPAYLQFIVDFYEHLPDRMLFMHSHEKSWHVKNMSKILSVLDPFAYDGEFTGLSRMYIKQGTQELHDEIRGFWEGNGLDENNSFMSSATFILSRENIYRHPKSTYERILRALDHRAGPKRDKRTSLYLEYLWHYIFTGSPVAHPPDARRLCPLNPQLCWFQVVHDMSHPIGSHVRVALRACPASLDMPCRVVYGTTRAHPERLRGPYNDDDCTHQHCMFSG